MSAKWLLLALLFRPGFGVTGNTPALVYSTYAGVGPNEIALSVAVDQDGNAYLLTSSAGSMLGSKVVVKKVSPDGSHLLFSTVLPLFILNDGGVFFPAAAAIAIDASGDIYVAGTLTDATLLKPTRGAAQSSPGGGTDGFVLKLSRDGSRVIYASYIGGSGSDTVTALCVDSGGNAYITGYTNSSDFPVTAGAYQTGIKGEDDAFVIKVNPTGTSFVYATYLGGAGIDQANAIAVDHVGNVHLTGATESADFPTTPAVAFPSQKRGGRDVFVSKLDSAGAVLLYSVCLGGSGDDEGRGIAVDPAGNIFVAGRTFSDDFPLQSALQDQGAAFAAKLIPGGSGGVVYSTRLGGLGWATGIAVNNLGEAFITGITDSDLPTTPRAYQPV